MLKHRLTVVARALIFSVLGLSGSVLAADYQQGELVIGYVEPGTQVWLGDVQLQVSSAGLYVFGLGRNAAVSVTLKTKSNNSASSQVPVNVQKKVQKRLYVEQKINGLPSKKVTPKTDASQRIRQESQLIGEVRQSRTEADWLGQAWINPVAGRISGVFGSRRILNGVPKNPHNGVDIAAAKGTNIVAPLTGRVALVHEQMFYTGKTIMLDHGLGVTSVYAHLSNIDVGLGQVVEQGQVMGQVGQTGRATGPHLHWGVTWQKTHVDPLLLVQ